ncbi:hypothetical protein [uncultured Tenacibaculum sp.]|uniref:hypothetical protein n=1 Tax=uncultured Tenacibaculum sp. TaxID=174713 RepID=UPI002626081D|nr:hypothetical protein [uncultured Tenacibaculum sp.]
MNISILSKYSLIVLLLLSCLSINAQRRKKLANKDTKNWVYDIECEGVGKKGFKLVKVWSYSKKPRFAIDQAMKNAVHGIIFKGYSGGGNSCTAFKALVSNNDEKHRDFFNKFFSDSGEYRKYVTAAADGNIAPGDRLKISRKKYKIGVVVNVATDQLRKRLETEGIIKALDAGF